MIPRTYFRIRIWLTAVKNRVLRYSIYSKDGFFSSWHRRTGKRSILRIASGRSIVIGIVDF